MIRGEEEEKNIHPKVYSVNRIAHGNQMTWLVDVLEEPGSGF